MVTASPGTFDSSVASNLIVGAALFAESLHELSRAKVATIANVAKRNAKLNVGLMIFICKEFRWIFIRDKSTATALPEYYEKAYLMLNRQVSRIKKIP